MTVLGSMRTVLLLRCVGSDAAEVAGDDVASNKSRTAQERAASLLSLICRATTARRDERQPTRAFGRVATLRGRPGGRSATERAAAPTMPAAAIVRARRECWPQKQP